MRDSWWYARLVILLGLASSYFIAQIISPRIAWEDGPLELLEAAFLFVGLVIALRHTMRTADTEWAGLWAIACVFWLAMLGRELSWGAVFLADTATSSHGPAYSSRDLWYKPVVYPAIVLMAIGAGVFAVRRRSWTALQSLATERGLPWAAIGLAAIGFTISLVAEGHAGVRTGLPLTVSQNLEEIAEFCAYLALLVAQQEVGAAAS